MEPGVAGSGKLTIYRDQCSSWSVSQEIGVLCTLKCQIKTRRELGQTCSSPESHGSLNSL